jgi:hypothetical protein
VLGGKTVRTGEPSFGALANSSLIINVGGGSAFTCATPMAHLIEVDQTTLAGNWHEFLIDS